MAIKKIKKTELKYPPITDGNKVSYLLLHLAVPTAFTQFPQKIIRTAQKAANAVGILLSTIEVDIENSKSPSSTRYLFRFP